MATNGERGGQCNPLVFLRDLKDKVEVRITWMEKTLATNPISTSMLQTRINNIERAWSEFKTQYHRLHFIAGRGWLQGLQAYHATFQRRYLEVHARAKAALKEAIKTAYEKANKAKTEQKNSVKKPSIEEEQAKEAVLKKVVMYGQKIAAWE